MMHAFRIRDIAVEAYHMTKGKMQFLTV